MRGEPKGRGAPRKESFENPKATFVDLSVQGGTRSRGRPWFPGKNTRRAASRSLREGLAQGDWPWPLRVGERGAAVGLLCGSSRCAGRVHSWGFLPPHSRVGLISDPEEMSASGTTAGNNGQRLPPCPEHTCRAGLLGTVTCSGSQGAQLHHPSAGQ